MLIVFKYIKSTFKKVCVKLYTIFGNHRKFLKTLH